MDRRDVGTARIIRGNALDLPLTDGSVDLIVTSPPYFGLRSYQDGGEHYEGQIGDEPTPAEFVDALIAVTAECMRVLKPSGSLWVNLGDKYASTAASISNNGTGASGLTGGVPIRDREAAGVARKIKSGVPTKSLIGIPWRYALRCIDDLGLILRAEVIWSKPNGLPESVTDRVRRSHEQWFHFTMQPRYYSAVDAIREEQAHHHTPLARVDRGETNANGQHNRMASNPLGKLPGSVWTIPTQPLRVPAHLGIDHFAAFPMEWPRRIIQGWSPSGVCVECGEGRRPVISTERVGVTTRATEGTQSLGTKGLRSAGGYLDPGAETWKRTDATITGYACACPEPTAPTTPAVVLDPFGGTGTTALLAKALGRHGISNDMSADYCRLATWRTNDEGELARAMQVEKPAAQVPGQTSLLDLFDEEASA